MHPMPRRGFLTLALALAGPAAVARAQTAPSRLALRGYDPVAYFLDGRAVAGRAEFETVFDDMRYRFASAAHLAAFRADPDRYAPEFGGHCAMGMTTGRRFEADPEAWVIADGKLFVFFNAGRRDEFRADFAARVRQARESWAATTLPYSKPTN